MRRVTLLVTMVGLVTAATSAGAVTLRYQGKAGEIRKYTFAMTSRMLTAGGPVQARAEGTATALLAHKITSVDDGVLTIEQKLTKGKTTMKMAGWDEPMTDEMPEVTTLVKMDAQGRIKQFKVDQTAGVIPTEGMERAFAELGAFPDRDLKVGDSWSGEKEITEPEVGTIKLRFNRKLAALEPHDKRDCAKIETKFEGSMEPEMGMIGGEDLLGGHSSVNVTFSGTAVTWFDYAAGLAIQDDVSMKMLTEMRFTMPAMGAGEDVEQSSKMAMIMNAKVALRK